ncbi:uncharacterized protein PAC_16596 [Phialocephala subalpina]|uniref:Fungal STAND N-terminal Goodbye domain-containing protein n=1 Tax=Phialocephala subalpina TaxID=576137 RepID=A0A1L7XNR9_9HELO|nr:uncharacterized protein PAC_16596 [Phialocephala subalpina]
MDHAPSESPSDVAALWGEALDAYTEISKVDIGSKLSSQRSVATIMRDQEHQLDIFKDFRHNKGKIEKIGSIISNNASYIQSAANQISSAASTAFLPSAAILTAFTYVSDGYNVIESLFDHMRSFFRRLSSLEGKIPPRKEFQHDLIKVFSSYRIRPLLLSPGQIQSMGPRLVRRQRHESNQRNFKSMQESLDKNNSMNQALLAFVKSTHYNVSVLIRRSQENEYSVQESLRISRAQTKDIQPQHQLKSSRSRPANFARLKRLLLTAAEAGMQRRQAELERASVRHVFEWIENDSAFLDVVNKRTQTCARSRICCAVPGLSGAGDSASGVDEDWHNLIESKYSNNSQRRQIFVLDGIDETEDEDIAKLAEIFIRVQGQNLEIQIIMTSDPSREEYLSQIFSKPIELVNPNFRKSIGKKASAKADSFLYIVHAMRRSDRIGYEGAVGIELEILPSNTTAVYETFLNDCQRNRSLEDREVLRRLLAWLAYAESKLTFGGAVLLINIIRKRSSISMDEAFNGPLARLLCISSSGDGNLADSDSSGYETDEVDSDDSEDMAGIIEDADSFLHFQERSLRAYFRQAIDDPHVLKCTTNEAQVIIFKIISTIPTLESEYGATILFYLPNACGLAHILEIEVDKVGGELAKEVLESLFSILSNNNSCLKLLEAVTNGSSTILNGQGEEEDRVLATLGSWARRTLRLPPGSLAHEVLQWFRPLAEEPHRVFIPIAREVIHDSQAYFDDVEFACQRLAELLFEDFRLSEEPIVKTAALEEMGELQGKLGEVLGSDCKAAELPTTVTLALMPRKLGPALDLADVLQAAFQYCVRLLTDDIGYNDFHGFRRLAVVLSCVGGLGKDAQVALTAQLYVIDRDVREKELAKRRLSGEKKEQEKEERGVSAEAPGPPGDSTGEDRSGTTVRGEPATLADEMAEGLLGDSFFCCNLCSKEIRDWAHGGAYLCLQCIDCDICEECFAKKEARENGEMEPDWRVMCPQGHRHVKAPVKGWRGVKDGRLRIGEKEAPFREWRNDLEMKWKACWDRY